MLDHFYYGAPWQISLKRFQQELTDEELSFYIRPLRKNAPFLSDLPGDTLLNPNNTGPDFDVYGTDLGLMWHMDGNRVGMFFGSKSTGIPQEN